ncbi:uncharacterized protein LOC108950144 isoform X2 [Ciona intestinalis]
MKADELKTANGYQAIKTKTMNFPPDIIVLKHSTKPSDQATQPPVVLRLLTSTNTEPRSVKKHIDENRVLPPVELTINKKIKYTNDKRHAINYEAVNQLTTSDSEVIEKLRHQLRTQPHEGTTSVLEAIGDPQVREERLYYEPLKSFIVNNEKAKHGKPGLPVVNIMIPLEDGSRESEGIVLPFTLSRHQTSTIRNMGRKRGGTTQAFSFLPSVVGNSIGRKSDAFSSDMRDFYLSELNHARDKGYGLGPAEPTLPLHRKTALNLPALPRVKRMEGRKPTDDKGETQQRRTAATVQFPARRSDNRQIEITNGFPRRATTTANGKSHLIGPMNKMDMIAGYSRAMQGGMMTYDEYIRKLSVLSLHKVTTTNGTNRHFQIVRDKDHHMQPRLAHVDVTAIPYTLPHSKQNSPNKAIQKVARPIERELEREQAESRVYSEMISNQHMNPLNTAPRLHKVDIGEGISFNEAIIEPDVTDDVITTDLTRYSHVHHPKQTKPIHFHWNHEVTSTDDVTNKKPTPQALLQGKLRQSDRNPQQLQTGTNVEPILNVSLSNSFQRTPGRVTHERSVSDHRNQPWHAKSRPYFNNKGDLLDLGEVGQDGNKISTMMQMPDLGKLPQLSSEAYGAASVGLAPDDVLKTINNRGSPSRDNRYAGDDTAGESDAESVMQQHIENVLKTIKRAKSRKQTKVPELKGLTPTVIPQCRAAETVLFENNKNQSEHEGVETSPHNISLLSIKQSLPENTPPPTANNKARQVQVQPDESKRITPMNISADFNENTGRGSPYKMRIQPPDNVKVVTDKSNSQLSVNTSSKRNNTISNPQPDAAKVTVNLDGGSKDNNTPLTRLEVVIPSTPSAPPGSIASTEYITTDAEDEPT